MSKGFLERIMEIEGQGTALVSSTTETSIIQLGNNYGLATLPAGYFERKGKGVRISARGRMSNIVTTPGTLTLSLRLGSIDVWVSGAIPLNIVAKTNVPWELVIEDLVCRSKGNGTGATLIGIGKFQSESVIGAPASSAGGNGSLLVPVGAPTVGSGFDSTAAQLVDLMATWSVSNAGNSIQLETFSMEQWS